MKIIRDQNTAGKLRSMVLLTSGIALLVSSRACFAIETFSYRQAMPERMEVLADFIAPGSAAAMILDDEETTSRLLSYISSKPSSISCRVVFYDASRVSLILTV